MREIAGAVIGPQRSPIRFGDQVEEPSMRGSQANMCFVETCKK